MAEKKKYNSILVSGRKDETLTYSRFIKDEESGESVKESLDKKVNATDKLETQQIKDGAITNEKLAADSVSNTNLQDGSVSNEKLEDESITNEKLAENAITKDKLKDNTIGVEKLDPELRQAINAATGLPEDLVETIQNVDDTLKDHQSQLDDKQSQIDDKQQQITANDEDISLLQTRSTQMEKAIKDISVSGGASQASAVTYENTESGLDSITAQGAIDELANKKFDKENIAQEFGDSKDKVASQFALPFREIESPEFIKVIVDANDHLLFTINLDGEVDWGKGIPTPIRAKLQEIINQCQQDKTDLLEAINAIKKELSASITALQEGKVDKEEGKSLIEDEVKECFRIIENEEFFKAIVDSDDKVLFGFYRATGKPYYPLNEMYHVEQNEEFFALWLDTDDKVLLGIRRDGEIIGEIHAVNALKQVISQLQEDLTSLQEKLGTIDSNLKELLDVFSLQENPEYLAVEKDADGRVLSATNPDGSHYIHNAKSETIPTEFEHIEDPEGRTEITTDAEDKILGYRDSEGTRHEHKISANHINLSDEAAKEVNEAFKSAGIKMENPSDFSKDSYVELPIPRIAAQVRLYAPKLPTTKQDDIEAEIEYNDKDGNYFRKPVILNAQGSSSMSYYVKNMAIDINDDSKIKFGDFPAQDSFHLKKYYIDAFRGQCIVGYWLMEQVYKSRPVGEQYPYEYLQRNTSTTNALGKIKKDFFNGAKCHPDGFPIVITWINSETNEEKWMGVYTWNLKKAREVYNADKKTAENIILDGNINQTTLFTDNIKWSAFEIRNPKGLIDIDGNKYDGDNPKELSDTDPLSKKVKDHLVAVSKSFNDTYQNQNKETFEKYFLPNPFIDYWLVGQFIYNLDGFWKNWIWCTWDGQHWTPTLYDVDSIFGSHPSGTYIVPYSNSEDIFGKNSVCLLHSIYAAEIQARYKDLRDSGIFSVNNVVSLFNKWIGQIGYDNLKADLELYNETPSYRNSYVSDKWELIDNTSTYREQYTTGFPDEYSDSKTYSVGEKCLYKSYVFKAKEEVTGIAPFTKSYGKHPYNCGYFNSVSRVANWLTDRIAFLDKEYNYNN